jgi:hypothetical protein
MHIATVACRVLHNNEQGTSARLNIAFRELAITGLENKQKSIACNSEHDWTKFGSISKEAKRSFIIHTIQVF